MRYFETFTSNTRAGSGNQSYFLNENPSEIQTARVFYKITVGGAYHYSILYSNIIDSTFSDGSWSHKNLICDEWQIHSLKAGHCKALDAQKTANRENFTDEEQVVTDWIPLTFAGKQEKTVAPAEFFATDAVTMEFEAGEFLCLEMTFSGRMIPCHPESTIASYVRDAEGNWEQSQRLPFAGMVGCDRKISQKVAFLGDSITQGCGTVCNAYEQWNAVLAEMLGTENAYWNLGLGYGRADDAASDGAWLYKAKQNDFVVVCYGVNDLFKGYTEEQIRRNLTEIVKKLHDAGVRVLVQTIPPFNYSGDYIGKWERLNEFILTELSEEADAVFDVVPVLGQEKDKYLAKFGGHPDGTGCAEWAKELKPVMEAFLKT